MIGHKIKGVEGIYNHHDYREEKSHAAAALAGLIESILRWQEGAPVEGLILKKRSFLAFFPITTPTHRGTCIPRSLSDRDAEFLTFDHHLHV